MAYTETLLGTQGNDGLTGTGSKNSSIEGFAGNDILDGGAGADLLIGGTGNDTYLVDSSEDVIVEEGSSADVDHVKARLSWTLGANLEKLTLTGTGLFSGTGNALANTLTGNTAANSLSGGDGNDTLIGLSGADTLDGQGGDDSLVGGGGNDTYRVDSLLDVINERGATASDYDTVFSSVDWRLTANLEALVYTGSGHFAGTGNKKANTITGGNGNDTLDGSAGIDRLVGGAGNDVYVADVAADVIVEQADGGIDQVRSGGNYTLGANLENLRLNGTGNNFGTGNELDNVIEGSTGDNYLAGLTGNDTVYGYGGADTLSGGTGADLLIGGAGNDTYVVDNAADQTQETNTTDNDSVRSSISWTLGNNLENLTLTGSARNGIGNALDNRVEGNTAANSLDGGAGNDTLIASAGVDTLTGNAGNDTFVFKTTPAPAADVERITDFLGGTDRIALDANVFTGIELGAAGSGNALDAGNRLLYNAGSGDLFYDADGAGGSAATLLATLDNHAALNRSDFVLLGNASLGLGSGLAGGATLAEATQTGGVVTVLGNSGESLAVTFTQGANSLTKTLAGNGAAQAVTLTAEDVAALGDGTVNVSAVASHAAIGISGPAVTASFVLDTVVPDAPILQQDAVNEMQINVTGLDAGAVWEYSTDGGAHWSAGTGAVFSVPNAGLYGVGQLQVRQQDAAGNASDIGSNAVAVNTDLQAPTLVSPTSFDQTILYKYEPVTLVFSEAVQAGSGNVVISNGSDTRTISVNDSAQVQINGNTVTINPTADFQYDTHYNVQITSDAFVDLAGNAYAGINNAFTLEFDVWNTWVNLADVAAGHGGFVVNGESTGDLSGYSVSSAGDVNGDGLADVLVGAFGSNTPSAVIGGDDEGRSYVIFGKSDTAAVNLESVTNGSGGFVINGQVAGGYSGYSVSGAGDVNGDGRADLIVGEPMSATGTAYVVFGKTGTSAVTLSSVTSGSGGFVIYGQSANDWSGYDVSGAGDVNGDGLADLIVGAAQSDSAAGADAGRSYVVFGKTGTAAIGLSAIAAGAGGFVINGQAAADISANVSSAGDVNGDGLADLIVGAAQSDPAAGSMAGRSFVVFGKSATSAVDLSAVYAGIGGFVINGEAADDRSGFDVSGSGDVNGDGLADLIVGAHSSDPAAGISAGRSYVVFGQTGNAAINLSAVTAGSAGFVINGQASGDLSGYSVSSAGDVNGDGLADLIVGARDGDPAAGGNAGRSYLVFGQSGTAAINLSAVALGSGGFVINGQAASDRSGVSVSAAGDVNGDGLADLVVGAYTSDPAAGIDAGRSYVIFGNTKGAFVNTAVDQYGTADADTFSDNGSAQTLVTGLGNDTLTATAASVLYGGAGNDTFAIGNNTIIALQSAMGSGGNVGQLSRIDGGTGIDTLALLDSGLTLNLTAIPNQAAGNPDGGSRIDSVEKIDLTGSGNNLLLIKAADVRDIAGFNTFAVTGRHQLLVTGNAGDTVNLADASGTGGWTNAGPVTLNGEDYYAWNHDTSRATVYADADLLVT